MKYRQTELLDRIDPGAAGTLTVPINIKDMISRIEITYHVLTDAGSYTQQVGSILSKIELTDGSDVLFSMSGLEAQALNIYDRRCPTMNGCAYNAGNYIMITFGIDFGRYLYDPELAFDPTKFNNPVLKLTYDRDAFDASCEHAYLEIFADCFDEKVVSPIGFLMSKLHHAYTPASEDSYQYIDLPCDYPLRQMLIRGYLANKAPDTVVDEARLSEENLKRVVFDIELNRYWQRMKGSWEPVVEQWQEYGAIVGGLYYKYFTPTSWPTILTAQGTADPQNIFLPADIRGGYMQWQSNPGNMSAGMIHGYLPNHCFQIPFGLQSELDSWYDVQLKSSVQLRLLSAADFASSVISTILQQLRTY